MIDRHLICNRNESLLTALELINKNCKGTVFIINDHQMLCGILTDGDARRALLQGIKLQDKVELAMCADFVYAYNTETEQEVLKRIDASIRIIPIVDKERHVVDYLEFNHRVRIPVAEPALSGNEFYYAIDAILSTWISSNGKYIKEFEAAFSRYCGCQYGVAVSNGTTAIHLALLALGVGPGDEVVVPDLTFAATINAVLHVQATPVIVDVENDSWCIDPNEIKKAITSKTKAIIPVHLYGQPCNMEQIMGIAREYSLYVIEDCAEAHGAKFARQKVGSFGDIACFSFFANKVITTGEGGMCITNSQELNRKMRVLRDHGMSTERKYWHEVVGYNYRMTNIQAAIGLAQLERIDTILRQRQEIEERYRKVLTELENIEFQQCNIQKREKIVWLVSILLPEEQRNLILQRLVENGIEVRPFFYSLSEMDIYQKYAASTTVNSRQISARGINVPTTLNISEETIKRIKNILKTAL